MKKAYNLKEVMDKQLKDIKISTELEETIKAQCLGKRRVNFEGKYKWISQVAIWFIGVVVILSGTAYAMSQIDGFEEFIDTTILEKIAPHVQNINESASSGNVKVVVESAITDRYNSIFVFSFINEGEEPWPQEIEAGDWNESWMKISSYGPPDLSQDGKKLTYYIEGSSDENILENKKFKFKASNLIVNKEVEEVINIPLGEIFEEYELVLDTIDYNYPPVNKGIYMRMNRMLKKKIGSSQRQLLKAEPEVTFEYMGMIKDSRLMDPNNPEGGLTLYTRSKSNQPWTGSGDNYTIGFISEVTDVRTGEVYAVTGRSIEYDSLHKGALGISKFRDLRDPSAIPYLKATKVIYDIQEVIVKDKWEVNFEVKDTTTSEPMFMNLTFREGGEEITIKQADFSIFGVTLQGTRKGRLEDSTQDSIYDKTRVKLGMKNGSEIELVMEMMGDKNQFVANYRPWNDGDEKVFVDVKEIEKLIINDEEIYLER